MRYTVSLEHQQAVANAALIAQDFADRHFATQYEVRRLHEEMPANPPRNDIHNRESQPRLRFHKRQAKRQSANTFFASHD